MLGTQSAAYLAASLVGGPLADRLGRRAAIVAGLLVQAAGMGLLALLPSLGGLLLAALVTGLGSGSVGAPAKAGIASLSGQAENSDAFSWRGVAANLGVTLGPLLGGLLVGRPAWLFTASAVLHAAMAGAMAVALPGRASGGGVPPPTALHGTVRPQVAHTPLLRGARQRTTALWKALRPVLADRPYLLFSLLTAIIWALYSQMNLAVPLRVAAVSGGMRAIGLLWTASAVVVIVTQVPLTRWLTPVRPLYRLAAGVCLVGLGLGAFGLAIDLVDTLLAMLVVTLGEMLVMPTVDALVARLAPGRALGTYFGIAAFVYSLGEAGGNALGGALIQRAGGGRAAAWLWLLFAGAGVALGLLTAALAQLPRFRGRPPVTP